MFPWYSNVPQDFTLPEDDRSAVQHLYGPPHEAGAEFPPLPRYPKETLPSVVPTHPTTVLPPGQSVPQKCQTNFDAVAVIRSEMWAFKGKYFWRISKPGKAIFNPFFSEEIVYLQSLQYSTLFINYLIVTKRIWNLFRQSNREICSLIG